MEDVKYKKLKSLLIQEYEDATWPAEYIFKFIVPAGKIAQVYTIFLDRETTTRPSKTGKYISVTCNAQVKSVEEILKMYKQVSVIDGIISL